MPIITNPDPCWVAVDTDGKPAHPEATHHTTEAKALEDITADLYGGNAVGAAQLTAPCVIASGECGYTFDEDEEGPEHFTDHDDARSALTGRHFTVLTSSSEDIVICPLPEDCGCLDNVTLTTDLMAQTLQQLGEARQGQTDARFVLNLMCNRTESLVDAIASWADCNMAKKLDTDRHPQTRHLLNMLKKHDEAAKRYERPGKPAVATTS